MKPTQVKRALEIVEEAIELDNRELESYLDSVCGDDLPLRREVLSYLEYDQAQTVVNDGPHGTNLPEIPDATSERYELGDEIARGGMGVVLHAFDNNLRRPVAIKILKQEVENNPDIVRRFLLEAHIGGQLQHPGIAPVYEIGRLADGHPSIAMKLVNGVTLQTLLKQRRDAADDQAKFLGIFEQICQAIAFAHRRGVIHRDLKPANVMVGEFGEVQVMDWGIAKLLNDDESIPDETVTAIQQEPTGTASEASIHEATTAVGGSQVDSGGFAGRTRRGVIMGTPAYMPPEQTIGRSDRMSDVFSLGAMLCEILTGEPTAGDLVAARDRLDRCGADNELCELAKSCIEQDPTDRPVDAGVVATRLSGYLNAIQSRLREAEIATARAEVKAGEDRKRRRKNLSIIAAVACLLLIAGIAGPIIALQQAELRTEADQLRKDADQQRDIAVAAGEQEALAKLLAEQRAEENRRHLYFAEMNLASLTTLDSTGLRTIRDLTRKWIPKQGEADLRGWEWHYLNNLYRFDLFSFDGHRNEVQAVEYSPDGTRAASLDRSGTLCIWNAADGAEILTREVKAHFSSQVRWNPAGNEVAFLDRDMHLVRLDLESGEVKMKVRFPHAVPWFLVWSPDGKRFAMGRDQEVAALIVNADNGDIEHVIDTEFPAFAGFAWGPEASDLAIASAGGDFRFAIWDADTGSSAPKRRSSAPLRLLCYSPDGKYLAGETAFDTPPRSIGVVDVETLKRVELFPGHFNFILSVVWTGDSQRVISSSWDLTVRIWKLGERQEQLVIPCENAPIRVSWNSANQQLAITEGERVRVVDGTSQSVQRWFGKDDLLDVRWSPDASRVLAAGRNGVVRVWDPETKTTVSEFRNGTGKAAHSACWSPDGIRIVTATTEIVIWDVADGTELMRLDGHRGKVFSVDWSPEGNRLASCGQDGTIRIWDTNSGEEVNSFSLEGASFDSKAEIRWSPDPEGRFLAVTSQHPEHRVSVLEAESLTPVKSLEDLDGSQIISLAWDPAGSRIAVGSMLGIQVFDRSSGELLRILRGHEGATQGIDWSPDGSRLASAGADRMIRLWDVESGLATLTIQGSRDTLLHLDWSSDGTRIVTSDPRYLNVWDGHDRSGE